jgi:hypothetical protein
MIDFRPKALVTDIDGTLTDEKLLINIDAIKYIRLLEASGIRVMLASGNALPILYGLARYIGAKGPIIAEDGGVIYYENNMHVLGDRSVPLRVLEELRERFGDSVKESFSNRYRVFDVAIQRTIPLESIIHILRKYPDITIVDSKFAYHIHMKDVDKGVGFLHACSLLNISPREAVAIGDSELDIPLFEKAGFSIATANAGEEVRRYASWVTSAEYGDGFVEGVKLVLESIKKNI